MTIFQAKVLKAVHQHEYCGPFEVAIEVHGPDFGGLELHNVRRAMDHLQAIGYINADCALTEKGLKRLGVNPEPAEVAPSLPPVAPEPDAFDFDSPEVFELPPCPEEPRRIYRCTVCHVNGVDAEDGVDICAECLRKA